jgi:ABC-type nitrate/sulfonate/bicarbonate transport system substrate-binding protein
MKTYITTTFKKVALGTLTSAFLFCSIAFPIHNIFAKEKLTKITLGIQTSPAMALVMVAKEKDFFKQQGLDVALKEFTAGKFALEAFLSGSLDYSISGDVPAALALMNGNEFIVPLQVVKSTTNEVRVVARKDIVEKNNSDAKTYFSSQKRKLATSIGGGPEFFTYEFLKALGIQKDSVEIIAQTPKDMPAAIASASVDAISIFDPVAYTSEKLLAEKGTTFTNKDIYSELYILEAKKPKTKQEKIQLEKLTKALVLAEKFMKSNVEISQEITSKYTKLDKTVIAGVWNSFDFKVALTAQLKNFWKREYVWAKEMGKIKAENLEPNWEKVLDKTYVKKYAKQNLSVQ